jgi:hypothetical protein
MSQKAHPIPGMICLTQIAARDIPDHLEQSIASWRRSTHGLRNEITVSGLHYVDDRHKPFQLISAS